MFFKKTLASIVFVDFKLLAEKHNMYLLLFTFKKQHL